jgi:hypothetical protein
MAEVGEKREREENAIEVALQELEVAATRDPELKVKALGKLRDAIDVLDESYAAQQDLMEAEGHALITQLLGDPSDLVASEAASVIAVIAGHSTTSLDRLKRDTLATPEKVALNPVQADIAEEEGLVA